MIRRYRRRGRHVAPVATTATLGWTPGIGALAVVLGYGLWLLLRLSHG